MQRKGRGVAYDFDTVIDRGPSSATYSMKWEGYESRFPGFDIDTSTALSMWVADMEFCTLPEVKQAILDRAEHGIYGYVSDAAVDEYRCAAKGWFARRYGLDVDTEWMLFSPGVVPAIYAGVQAFTEPGDGVVVQPPVYYPFISAVRDSGRTLVFNQLRGVDGRYEMDFDSLEAQLADPATKLLVLCNPHNPVGRVWTHDELLRLLTMCHEHGVLVLSDEIHADFIMPGSRFCSAGTFAQFHDTLVLAHATSKTFNLAGLQSSLLTVPNPDVRARLEKQMRINSLSYGSTFGPLAGAAAYTHGDQFVDELVEYLDGNFRCVEEGLARDFPQLRMHHPEGTYLAWIDFSGLGLPEDEIYRIALEEAGVVGDLGNWFGPGGEGFMRFNLACPRSVVHEFLDRLAALNR